MDWNVIQTPELLGKLQRLLGLRQAHVAPTLNEGVQAVVVLADVNRDSQTAEAGGLPRLVAARNVVAGGALTGPYWQLHNPASSGVIVRPKVFAIACQSGGFPLTVHWTITTATIGGAVDTNPRHYVQPESLGTQPPTTQFLTGTDTLANMVGGAEVKRLGQLYILESTVLDVPVDGIVLTPGWGLRMFGDVGAGTSWTAHVQWTEQDVDQ